MTYTRILSVAAVLSAVFASALPAQADKIQYHTYCVTCSNGQTYEVQSKSLNPGISFGNSFCASRGAGTLTGISQAQILKLGGKVRIMCPRKMREKVKLF